MNKYNLTPKHKLNITKAFLVIFLTLAITIYFCKVCGLNIWKPVIVSESVHDFSMMLEGFWLSNILLYSVLGYICLYFITFALAGQFGTKSWWKNLILVSAAILFSFLRWKVVLFPTMTFLYDLIQYIVLPLLFCKFLLGKKLLKNIDVSIKLFLSYVGLIAISMTLNGFVIEGIYINFVSTTLIFMEVYVGIICFYLISIYNKRSLENESNGNDEQESRKVQSVHENCTCKD